MFDHTIPHKKNPCQNHWFLQALAYRLTFEITMKTRPIKTLSSFRESLMYLK